MGSESQEPNPGFRVAFKYPPVQVHAMAIKPIGQQAIRCGALIPRTNGYNLSHPTRALRRQSPLAFPRIYTTPSFPLPSALEVHASMSVLSKNLLAPSKATLIRIGVAGICRWVDILGVSMSVCLSGIMSRKNVLGRKPVPIARCYILLHHYAHLVATLCLFVPMLAILLARCLPVQVVHNIWYGN
jgi:hypothetical protein